MLIDHFITSLLWITSIFDGTCREIIISYASKLHSLIVEIASKVADGLGLVGHSFQDWPCQFRLNKYNFTKETVGSPGVQIHTDSGFLTVLQEDESVGGLEIMDSTGNFVAVDPVPGTFLVNLGDVAKVNLSFSLYFYKLLQNHKIYDH